MDEAKPSHLGRLFLWDNADMNKWDVTITAGATAVGVGAVAAHHVDGDAAVKTIMTDDLVRGVVFGAGGGAAVAFVSKASVIEMLGRVFVGGLLAAVAAPWIAETLLKIPTTATSYPVLCTSIGVLGFQIVKNFIHNPESLPVIGSTIGRFAKKPATASEQPAQAETPLPPPKGPQLPSSRPGGAHARPRVSAPMVN